MAHLRSKVLQRIIHAIEYIVINILILYNSPFRVRNS
jgi:hypothetical protein